MSAEYLRETARMMREIAEAATPGPWHVPRRGEGIDAGEWDTVIGPGRVDCMSYCYGGTSTLEGDRIAEDQRHIVAWSPPVAPTVAGWLEDEAAVDEYARLHGGRGLGDESHAVRVANAWRGDR